MKRYSQLGFMLMDSEYDLGDLFVGSYRRNPITVGAAGINLIAGGCVTMSGSVILSIMMLALLPLVGAVAAFEDGRLSKAVRPAVYALLGGGVALLVAMICERVSTGCVDRLGIYLPLAALDTLVFVRLSDEAPRLTIAEGFVSGAGTACCFAVLAMTISFVRELFGAGAIFGKYLFSAYPSLQSPYFGFILCGLALAIAKKLAVKRAMREND